MEMSVQGNIRRRKCRRRHANGDMCALRQHAHAVMRVYLVFLQPLSPEGASAPLLCCIAFTEQHTFTIACREHQC